jgi:hypothetical protein
MHAVASWAVQNCYDIPFTLAITFIEGTDRTQSSRLALRNTLEVAFHKLPPFSAQTDLLCITALFNTYLRLSYPEVYASCKSIQVKPDQFQY